MPTGAIWLSMEPESPPGNDASVHRPMLGAESMLAGGWPIRDPRARKIAWDEPRVNAYSRTLGGKLFPGTIAGGVVIAMIFSIGMWDDARGVISIPADAEHAAGLPRKRRGSAAA